jgi:soluble lytic murein transglycosylase-like protein
VNRPSPASPAATLLVALILVWPAGVSWAEPGPPSLTYDLTAFAQFAPSIVSAYQALEAGDPEGQATPADLSSLAAALREDQAAHKAGPWSDPHTHQVASWLAARLDPGAVSLPQGTEDGAAQSPLLGEARAVQADAARGAGELTQAADHLLSIPSSVAGHWKAWREGAALLAEAGAPDRAAAALRGQLLWPLSRATRRAATLLVAELYVAAGEKSEASAVLVRLWWDTDRAKTRTELEARLQSMNSPVSGVIRFARPLLDVRSGARKAEQKRLKKLARARASDKALVDWGLALLARLDSRERLGAIGSMARLEGRMKGDVRRPLWHLGSAMVLRRSNRDLEAAVHYAALASSWPEHPAADRARVEAGWLLSQRGLPAEAAALWREAAASKTRSEAQRDALWWAGFSAVIRGEGEEALGHLATLRDRFGSERDGIAITWEERATYWLGRAYESMARVPDAMAAYAAVCLRYPLSWYATLGAARIAALDPLHPGARTDLFGGEAPDLGRALEPVASAPALSELYLVREASLDLAVAYVRLEDDARAVQSLETLVGAGRITAGGRALLAVLYERQGKLGARERILRYGLVITGQASPSLVKSLRARHRLAYEEILIAESVKRGLAPALMAGLVHVESRFRPRAKSGPGAVGLAQIMPSTARLTSKALLGRKVSRRALAQPAVNLELGAALLGALLDHFRGHPALALAAYNAGRGAVRGWLRNRGHLPTDAFVEAIPYGQTRRYVMRVISEARIYAKLYAFEGRIPALPFSLPLTLGAFDADSGSP